MKIAVMGDDTRGGKQLNLDWLYPCLKEPVEFSGGELTQVLVDPSNAASKALDLNVGFELQRETLAELDGTRWINLRIHPIRFCDDIMFHVEQHGIELPILPVNEATIRHQANIIKARCAYKVNAGMWSWLAQPTAVIVGQIKGDGALGGHWFTDSEFSKPMGELASTGLNIVYKPHPGYSDPEWMRKGSLYQIRDFPVGICTDNIYKLMCSPNVFKFVGLTSSALTEAPYFGKQSEAWVEMESYSDPFRAHDFFSFETWAAIQEYRVFHGVCPKPGLDFSPNRYRMIRDMWWGLKEVWE